MIQDWLKLILLFYARTQTTLMRVKNILVIKFGTTQISCMNQLLLSQQPFSLANFCSNWMVLRSHCKRLPMSIQINWIHFRNRNTSNKHDEIWWNRNFENKNIKLNQKQFKLNQLNEMCAWANLFIHSIGDMSVGKLLIY